MTDSDDPTDADGDAEFAAIQREILRLNPTPERLAAGTMTVLRELAAEGRIAEVAVHAAAARLVKLLQRRST